MSLFGPTPPHEFFGHPLPDHYVSSESRPIDDSPIPDPAPPVDHESPADSFTSTSGEPSRNRAPVVELHEIERTFEGSPPIQVLKGVDLTIREGDYVSIVGPSGSGKSTLLNILGLLDRPTAGSYLLDGFEARELSDIERTALRGSRLGFVFQSFHLLAHRTTVENVVLAQLYNRSPAKERTNRAVEALTRVGLAHRLDAFPPTLSGGERQRVAIARALVSRPSVLLADEPTGNLDGETTESILELLAQLHVEGLTLVVITHDTDVAQRAERIVTIEDGHLRELTATTSATVSDPSHGWSSGLGVAS